MGHTTKEEDEVVMLLPARSLDSMLFFSDRGKVYSEKVYQIPDADRSAKGIPLVNVLSLGADERITAAIAVSDFAAHGYCIMATTWKNLLQSARLD
jgi:DNA gyrase subunit A